MSTLLRVTMSDQLDLPVRQAGEAKCFGQNKSQLCIYCKAAVYAVIAFHAHICV